jgi:hypothetical protein
VTLTWLRAALALTLPATADPRARLLERRLGELTKGYDACFVLYSVRTAGCRGARGRTGSTPARSAAGCWRRCRLLFSGELDDDLALPRTHVEVDQDDLLPRAEQQLPILDGHGHRWP